MSHSPRLPARCLYSLHCREEKFSETELQVYGVLGYPVAGSKVFSETQLQRRFQTRVCSSVPTKGTRTIFPQALPQALPQAVPHTLRLCLCPSIPASR